VTINPLNPQPNFGPDSFTGADSDGMDKPKIIAGEAVIDPLLVLVVEDNRSLREATVKALCRLGHLAKGIANGEELDEALAAGPLDIVLLDVGLGEGREDGFTLAARLRRQTRCGIIMTTARGEREVRIRGFEAGTDAYLVKPVDFDELNAVMQSVMRRLQ
jgi:DNA-binding response OmpR family regulator